MDDSAPRLSVQLIATSWLEREEESLLKSTSIVQGLVRRAVLPAWQ